MTPTDRVMADAEASVLPERMCVTEAWPPNAQRAREVLVPRGVEVHETHRSRDKPVQLDDLIRNRGAFVAHSSRHLIETDRQARSSGYGVAP